ncbi:MAG: IS110 family transposase [Thermomicrobiales bacterium]
MIEVMYPRCCGLDVHKKFVTACVLGVTATGTGTRTVREFSTMTADLLRLSDWLADEGVTQVAMESTGVYWKPVWNLLEGQCEQVLVNPAHMKAVPGRKTDVKDAEWIADLLQHGLLRASFVPARPERELRELTRYRTQQVRVRAAEVNRLQKTLEGANIKLGNVVSDVTGVSATAMLEALVAGTTDVTELADLAVGTLKRKRTDLQQALHGRLNDHQRFMIAQHLEAIRFLDGQIERVSGEIEERLAPFGAMIEVIRSIPGCGTWTAQVILAEIGTDMSRFPSPGHLSSWAGMCPGHDESGGKRRSGRIRHGSPFLRTTLVESAYAASRSNNTYLSELFARLMKRKGRKRAGIAVGRIILETIHRLLSTGELYDDTRFRRQSELTEEARLVRKLEQLGHTVTLDAVA